MTYPHWSPGELDLDEADAVWYQKTLEEQQEKEMKARQQSGGGGDFKVVDVGVHAAVLFALVDIGMQKSWNPSYKDAYKIMLGFQFPDQLRDDGAPQTIFLTETASMAKKANLRKIVESWYGKAFPDESSAANFDLKNLLGRPAFVNVIHKEKGERTYANISTVMALPKGVAVPAPVGDLIYYSEAGDLTPPERSAAYAKLPDWIKRKVDEQLVAEAKAPAPAAAESFDGDDEIPF